MQILEANERKVGKVRFIPINNEHGENLDNKDMTRVVSGKVDKQADKSTNELDSSDEEIEVGFKDGCSRSHEAVLQQDELQL